MIHLDFIATGTPRSGSVYTARLLTSLGVVCGHESIFHRKGIDVAQELMQSPSRRTSPVSRRDMLHDEPVPRWFDQSAQRAECSWMAAPFLDHPTVADAAIIHGVRNPLATISSLYRDMHFFRPDKGEWGPFRRFALQHMPDVMHLPDELERTCLYWVQWHELILQKAAGRRYFLYRVESKVSDELIAFLGVPPERKAQAFVEDHVNSWKRRGADLTLMHIPPGDIRDRLVALAGRLGYTLESS